MLIGCTLAAPGPGTPPSSLGGFRGSSGLIGSSGIFYVASLIRPPTRRAHPRLKSEADTGLVLLNRLPSEHTKGNIQRLFLGLRIAAKCLHLQWVSQPRPAIDYNTRRATKPSYATGASMTYHERWSILSSIVP